MTKEQIVLLWLIRKLEPISIVNLQQTVQTLKPGQYPKPIFDQIVRSGLLHAPQKRTVREDVSIPSREVGLLSTAHSLLTYGLVEFADADESLLQLLNPLQANWRAQARQITIQPLKTAPHLHAFLSAFEMSLTTLLEQSGFTLTAAPIFGEPFDYDYYPDLFVIMPFSKELEHIYTAIIKPIAGSLDLSVMRGDEFSTAKTVIREVWSAIHNAQICIAECTGRNPNVFYETGIAHTVGRKTILIAQSEDDIPFNVQHMRFIIYTDTEDGLEKLHRTLKATLKSELEI